MPESLDQLLIEFNVQPRDVEVSLGVTSQAVYFWRTGQRTIRPEHAILLEERFGLPRHRTRPDLWSAPPFRASRSRSSASA